MILGKWKDYWVTIDEDLAFGAWFWKFDDVDMATSLTFFLSTATLGLTKLKAKTLFVKAPVAMVMLNVQDRGSRPSPEKPPWLVLPQPKVPLMATAAAKRSCGTWRSLPAAQHGTVTGHLGFGQNVGAWTLYFFLNVFWKKTENTWCPGVPSSLESHLVFIFGMQEEAAWRLNEPRLWPQRLCQCKWQGPQWHDCERLGGSCWHILAKGHRGWSQMIMSASRCMCYYPWLSLHSKLGC